ncbi:glycosyltransferase family 2 protein [Patescibacteria group bacterium]
MKISVIIATYNDPLLNQCLDSIFNSKNVLPEIIVIDDGSTKVSVEEIVAKYPNTKLFTFEKNKGPAVARNFGVKKATGNIVFFLDSDAQVYPDTFEKIYERFQKDPKLQGLTISWSDESIKNNFFNKFKAVEGNYLFTNLITKSFGSNGSAIYKDLFLKEGGFDENFKTANAEDFYFGLKLFNKGYKIDLDKKILMKNSYLDSFFFEGMKKYCQRAFLRAMVLYQIKNKTETSYNSKMFKILYLLSGVVLLFVVLGLFFRPLLYLALLFYFVFFFLNRSLYNKFYKKHGAIFSFRTTLLHYFYILVVSIAGTTGLIFAHLTKKKKSL